MDAIPRTRVKICGITREQDARCAALAGADAIGLVFYSASPRYVELAQARGIVKSLPPLVQTVALFVNAPSEQVAAVIDQLCPSFLQFHGDETPQQCEQYQYPYLRAIRMTPQTDLMGEVTRYPHARGFLLDSFSSGYGGSGKSIDWDWLQVQRQIPLDPRFILSGGLHADNVGEAITRLQPGVVDASSGLETAPGIKSADRINRFMSAVRQADLARSRV